MEAYLKLVKIGGTSKTYLEWLTDELEKSNHEIDDLRARLHEKILLVSTIMQERDKQL